MDLIRTDIYGRELGYVMNTNIDFEVGEENDSINDFEVEYKRFDWTGEVQIGCRMFSPNTEYGGIVRHIATDTKANTVKAKGYTWRGMMTKKVIEPPSGAAYATDNGELNSIIKKRVESAFPGLFYGTEKSTGVTVDFQYDRYCPLHEGLVEMLKSAGYRLDIRYMQGATNEIGWVQVQAVPIVDFSEEYEFSEDNNMHFTMDDNKGGVNHLICLGKGELQNRLVIHLYTDSSGKIGTKQYYKGVDEISEVYDSSGSERDDLLANGKKKLEEEKSKTEYNMTMEKIDGNIDIGDIVGGRDYLMGVSVKKPIDRKIWTISYGEEKIEYKLKGEN